MKVTLVWRAPLGKVGEMYLFIPFSLNGKGPLFLFTVMISMGVPDSKNARCESEGFDLNPRVRERRPDVSPPVGSPRSVGRLSSLVTLLPFQLAEAGFKERRGRGAIF